MANEGDKVVALIDGEATIKEFHRVQNMIILKPRSSNRECKPIILTDDFQIQGVVVTAIPDLRV
jgi:repressor LexA